MTVDQLIAFYNVKNRSHLAKKINVGRSTICGWQKTGIPLKTQAMFEVLSKGELKADLQVLSA